ncbi:ladinin-1 [Scleropages formosus]|uniref:ladinin-1 n=1 Tax=Scleropages formosus TaxID=113540 RepID=UPI0010FA9F2A|nr:ladinin-1 [Scleropages formosus]
MSISRKNWSALSSLTRQWTVEDEEEVERERRRKIRSHSSTAEPDDSPSEDSSPAVAVSSSQDSRDALEQAQVDFIEMLRIRDEKRRRRQEEALRRQRQEEDAQQGEDQRGVETGQPKQAGGEEETCGRSQDTLTTEVVSTMDSKGSENSGRSESKQEEKLETPGKASRKFVSSLSVTFDKGHKSPPAGSSTVSSPLSPTGSFRAASPEQTSADVRENGDAQESPLASPSEGSLDKGQTPFKRQNYRAWSFRLMRKKEEQSVPFQRSASFRNSSNSTEHLKAGQQIPSHEDDKQSPFKRNTRQRLSSRSIQETMERLALAAQKSESVKSPTAPQRTLYLADEVSRKRELFEKEQADGESDRDNQCLIAEANIRELCFICPSL